MPPPRRLLFLGLAAALWLSSCGSCVDRPAQPVTLQLVNRLTWPIFVEDEYDQLGLTVQHSDSGTWLDMAEEATCDCQECPVACDPCDCPTFQAMAHRVQPGATLSRVWSGEFRADDRATCDGHMKACLGDRLAAQPGTYRLKLCWASSLPNAPTDVERFKAEFPADLTCAYQTFEVPAKEPVTVETNPPPGCLTAAQCPEGQMCLSGSCSATCLPNDVPALGGEWTLEVGSPDDAGFFTATSGPGGSKILRGTGKIATVRYASGTTNLTVTRLVNGIDYTVSLYYTLPARRTLALTVGDNLDVEMIDYSSASAASAIRKQARGLVLRQNGRLVLAADNGFDGPALDVASLLPFSVDVHGDIFACSVGDCGKRMDRLTRFFAIAPPDAGVLAGDGGTLTGALALQPGKAATLEVGDDVYEVVSVADYADEVDGCGPSPMTPYVVLFQPRPP